MSYFRTRKVHTTTVLAGLAVYTSDWMRVDQYDRITGLVFSDQSGSLVIQQSTDGSNVDFAHSAISVTGGTGEEIDFKIYGEWFRAVYTNGATPQGSFRMALYCTPMG